MDVYRNRLPVSETIVAETVHNGFAIDREAHKDVEYAPPSRLRHYDLFLLDEASQIDGAVVRRLFMDILELPQKAYTVISTDFQQLNPIVGGAMVRRFVSAIPHAELRTIHRTSDPVLHRYCMRVRCAQPAKARGRFILCWPYL